MTRYYYAMTQRPPAPGAMPSGAEIEEDMERFFTKEFIEQHHVYAVISYDHPLTAKEVRDYELSYCYSSVEDFLGSRRR